MKIAVYPGSFDPITIGHLDIIKRSTQLFDKVIVAVVKNPNKNPFFTIEQRVDFIKQVTKDLKNIEVDCFEGLLVDFIRQKNADIIIRGLRAISDFEYEFQMASMNHKLDRDIETVFMMTNTKYSYLSSSIVREVGSLGGCIKQFVPDELVEQIQSGLKNGR